MVQIGFLFAGLIHHEFNRRFVTLNEVKGLTQAVNSITPDASLRSA
jgi:hypothetical protein